MIKKYLAAVTFAFMIIFAGSQSNIAEAKEVYIGNFSSRWVNFLQFKKLYLFDDTVTCDSYSVNNSMIIQCIADVTDFATIRVTFRRVSTKDWVFMYSFAGGAGGGGGGTSAVSNVHWDDVDGKLLKYILNNYE